MNSSGDDFDGKTVAEPGELETSGQSRSYLTVVRGDEPRGVLAKGTREHPTVTRDPDPIAVRSRGTRELTCERDPVEVLRMWPHSISSPEGHEAPVLAAPPAPAGKRAAEDGADNK